MGKRAAEIILLTIDRGARRAGELIDDLESANTALLERLTTLEARVNKCCPTGAPVKDEDPTEPQATDRAAASGKAPKPKSK